MELSIAYELYMKPHEIPTDFAMKIVRDAGYRYVDMSIGPFCKCGDAPFLSKDWKRHAESTVKTASDNGITMNQAHCLLFDYIDDNCTEKEYLTEVNLHLFDVCRALGIRYFIFHAGTDHNAVSSESSLEKTVEYLKQFAEKAEKTGVCLCIENNFDWLTDRIERAFGAYPDEIAAVIDALGSKYVGACWDTGHAHIARLNQGDAVRLLGKRLMTTHVHDNKGQYSSDLHLPPFYGTIDWQSFMNGLSDVNYEGTLNFELEPHTIPQDFMLTEFKSLYEKGERLISMLPKKNKQMSHIAAEKE